MEGRGSKEGRFGRRVGRGKLGEDVEEEREGKCPMKEWKEIQEGGGRRK